MGLFVKLQNSSLSHLKPHQIPLIIRFGVVVTTGIARLAAKWKEGLAVDSKNSWDHGRLLLWKKMDDPVIFEDYPGSNIIGDCHDLSGTITPSQP